jgi:hypothetical protein
MSPLPLLGLFCEWLRERTARRKLVDGCVTEPAKWSSRQQAFAAGNFAEQIKLCSTAFGVAGGRIGAKAGKGGCQGTSGVSPLPLLGLFCGCFRESTARRKLVDGCVTEPAKWSSRQQAFAAGELCGANKTMFDRFWVAGGRIGAKVCDGFGASLRAKHPAMPSPL